MILYMFDVFLEAFFKENRTNVNNTKTAENFFFNKQSFD